MKNLLVLGLGNDILCDDTVGLSIIYELKKVLPHSENVTIEACCEMGLALLDYFEGYSSCILVDSVVTGKVPPGHLHELTEKDISFIHTGSPHFLGIREVISLGNLLGYIMPDKIKVFAIEVKDPYTVGTEISSEVSKKLPFILQKISDEIISFIKQ